MIKRYKSKGIILLLMVLFLGTLSQGNAQNGIIKGRVYNVADNTPVPFASVLLVGTTIGAVSDYEGNFLITGVMPGFQQLRVTSVGYATFFSEEFSVTNAKEVFVSIPMEKTAREIETFTVTSSAFRKAEESPVSMRTISLKDIEKAPGGNRDISKVIQSLPGVSSGVSFRNDVIVRGGGSSENSFFIDGIEIPNLNHFATQGASGGPVGIINTDFLREVELYSGAFPVNRGNALSSVLDMKQITGDSEKLRFKGSVGATDLALTANGPIGEKTSFVLSARRSYLQFLFGIIGLPFLPTYNDYQLKITHKIDAKNQLDIISLGALDKFNLNTGIENPDESQAYILGYLPVFEQWNYTIGAVYRHFGKNHTDTWVLSRNMLDNRQLKYRNNDDSNPANLILDYLSQEIENKIRYERKFSSGVYNFLVGTGAQYAKYSNETFRRIVALGEIRTEDYNSALDLYKWSAFASMNRKLLKRRNLVASLGVRMDGNSYSPSMANPLNQFSPRLSLSYLLDKKWSLNMNIGRFYQLPPYTTLGYKSEEGIFVNKDNMLKYIRADHIVAGVEYLRTPLSKFTIETFYKHYTNYMFSLNDSVSLASKGADFGTFGDEPVSSTATGRAYGAEMLFREKDIAGFNIILSYTYVRSEFLEKNNTFVPSAWDNRHLINLVLQRSFKRNWDAGLRWRYVGGPPYTPFDVNYSAIKDVWNTNYRGYLDYDRYNALRLDAGHQLDIRIDKGFYFDQWSLMVYLDIQNVYNFKARSAPVYILDTDANGVPLTDPADPNRYLLKEIRTENGNILPSVGIIIEL